MDDEDLPDGEWTDEGYVIYGEDGEVALIAEYPYQNLE